MAKVVLNDINSYASTSLINENFEKIENELNNKVLYRDNPVGQPNQMESDLDMNSNDILNAGVINAKRVVAESIEGDDEAIIEGGIAENELVKWDPDIAKLVGTGVYSTREGEITTSSNSVNIGVHDVGSAGRNVMFTNRVDDRHFAPVWQENGILDSRTTKAIYRDHGNLEEYAFGTDSSTVLTDPAWSFVAVGDQTDFTITLWPANNMDNVVYEVLEQGEVIYRDELGSFTLDDNSTAYVFASPFDLYTGVNYTARLYTSDGSICRFRGSATGTPWYKVDLRAFTSRALATESYVTNSVNEAIGNLPDYITDVPVYEDEFATVPVCNATSLAFPNASVTADITDPNKAIVDYGVHPTPKYVRYAYVADVGSTVQQTLVSDNTPEVITLNTIDYSTPEITVDLGTGIITFEEDVNGVLSYCAQVTRTTAAGVDALYTIYAERSEDGVIWEAAPGSAISVTLTDNSVDDIHQLELTTVGEFVGGTKYRFLHSTTAAATSTSLLSDGTGTVPPASAFLISAYFIK